MNPIMRSMYQKAMAHVENKCKVGVNWWEVEQNSEGKAKVDRIFHHRPPRWAK
jgi:hypothetical protein